MKPSPDMASGGARGWQCTVWHAATPSIPAASTRYPDTAPCLVGVVCGPYPGPAHHAADRLAEAAHRRAAQLWPGHHHFHNPGARRARAAEPAPATLGQEDGDAGAENQRDTTEVQGRSRGADQGADGALQRGGRQPSLRLPPTAGPDAHPVRAVLCVSSPGKNRCPQGSNCYLPPAVSLVHA